MHRMENPSRKIEYDELVGAKYVQATYRKFTTRTLVRELSRLAEMGFITINKGEKDFVLELNFESIGKY